MFNNPNEMKWNENDNGGTCEGGAKRPQVGVFIRRRFRFISFRLGY